MGVLITGAYIKESTKHAHTLAHTRAHTNTHLDLFFCIIIVQRMYLHIKTY